MMSTQVHNVNIFLEAKQWSKGCCSYIIFHEWTKANITKKIICIAFLEIILRTVSMEHITVTCFLRKKRKCVAEAEMICSVDAEIEIDEPSCQNQNKHPARLFTCCCYCPRTWQSTYVLLPTANPLRRRRILRWRAGLVFQRKKRLPEDVCGWPDVRGDLHGKPPDTMHCAQITL